MRVWPSSISSAATTGQVLFEGPWPFPMNEPWRMHHVRPWFLLNGATIVGEVVSIDWSMGGGGTFHALADVEIR